MGAMRVLAIVLAAVCDRGCRRGRAARARARTSWWSGSAWRWRRSTRVASRGIARRAAPRRIRGSRSRSTASGSRSAPRSTDSFTAECDAPRVAPAAEPLRLELHVHDVGSRPQRDDRRRARHDPARCRRARGARRRGQAGPGVGRGPPRGPGLAPGARGLAARGDRRRRARPARLRDLPPGLPDARRRAPRQRARARRWGEAVDSVLAQPVLLAGAAGAAAAISRRWLCIRPGHAAARRGDPLALGAFAITGTILDAFVHEHLGATRGRVLLAGGAAAAAVPIFQSLDGPLGIFQMVLGGVVIAMILWSVLDSI